ncbi:MAG: hypothetical protein D6713_09000 [Deltaproteobacteria bacterium]|nr:MAG: hypothetical protein D6713_09000 [Deltaproteobacteria bacterium]
MRGKLFSHVSVFLLSAATLALTLSCGGGGGVSPSPGNRVTVTTDADWAAYQVGSGPWTVVALSGGSFSFALDSSGKYGVALHNPEGPGSSNDPDVVIYQASKEETTRITHVFSLYQESGEVRGSIYNLGVNEVAYLYLFDFSSGPHSNGGSYDIIDTPAVTTDIIGVALNVSNQQNPVPLRATIHRVDVPPISQGPVTEDFDFSSGATFDLVQRSVSVTGGSGEVLIASKNGTVVSLGDTQAGYFYAADVTDPQSSQIESGDLYVFHGWGSALPGKEFFRTYDATGDPGSLDKNINEIASFTGGTPSSSVPYPEYTGLSYTPSGVSPELRAFLIRQDQTQGTNFVRWEVYISTGWLDTNTTYQVPDLSMFNTFPTSATFQNGYQVDWTVSAFMSSATIQEIIDVGGDPEYKISGLAMDVAFNQGSFTP